MVAATRNAILPKEKLEEAANRPTMALKVIRLHIRSLNNGRYCLTTPIGVPPESCF
jgi:hypothetical protein